MAEQNQSKYLSLEEELDIALEVFSRGKVGEGVALIKSLRGRTTHNRIIPVERCPGPDDDGFPRAG